MFVALIIQHAQRMRLIILEPLACQAVPYCATLSHKWNGYIVILVNVLRSSCKNAFFLSDFNETWIFCIDFLITHTKLNQNPFSGSRVISCGLTDGLTDRHIDRQKDLTKLIVALAILRKILYCPSYHSLHLLVSSGSQNSYFATRL